MAGVSRLQRAGAQVDELGLDGLLVTTPSNIRYLTGFTGSTGYVLVGADGTATAVTDRRYEERIADELTDADVRIRIAPGAGRRELTELLATGSLGVEAANVSWAEVQQLTEMLGSERVRSTTGVIEGLREHKDELEVDIIRRAAAIADRAFGAVIANMVPGTSELDIAYAFESAVREAGGDGIAYDTIVASGPNASRPHHATGRRGIEQGDLVIVDAGAMVDGYRSDMTRTFVIGEPTDQQQVMLDAVLEAQIAGVAAVTLSLIHI